MAFRTISVVLSANARSLNAAMYQASRSIDAFAGGVEGKGVRSLIKFGAAATAVTLGAYGFERALTASVRAAVQFDASMRNVNSISHLSERQLAQLSGSVLDLSRQLPQSANNLAQGLYDIASSGFQGAEGLTVLKASAQAASAGITDTQTSAKAIVAVLNAYGLSAGRAGAVSDSLFQTVNVGVLSFEELAQNLGDVVGTAAQASVDINEVGSAIATITLSGISAAESTTALNRLLQELISPSKTLAVVFEQLGYESGVAALKSKGLHGVMEDIRKATGGNIVTLKQLFPDIRGLKGALALVANEGKNYNRVARQIENENNRQGATHRALAEQLKSVQAQWSIFQNKMSATAIEAATHLLPSLIQLMQVMTQLGTDAGPVLARTMSDLAPFFRSVHDIGVDLVTVLTDLAKAVEPVASAIAAIGAAGVIATLNSLAQVLAGIAGFLADHKTLVEAVAVIYLSRFVPAILAAVQDLGLLVVLGVDAMLEQMGVAAEGAATSMRSLSLASTAFNLTVTAGVLGVLNMATAWGNARQAATQYADSLQSTNIQPKQGGILDPTLVSRIEDQLNQTIDAANHYNNVVETLQFVSPFGSNKGVQLTADAEAGGRLVDDLVKKQEQAANNLLRLNQKLYGDAGLTARTYNHNFQTLRSVAASLSPELQEALTQPWSKAGDGIAAVRAKVRDLEAQSGSSLPAIGKHIDDDIAKLQAMAKRIDEVGKKTSQAFSSASDVIANFHPDQAAEQATQAASALADARKSLSDLQSQTGKQAASESQLADARKRVADAQKSLNDATQAGDLRAYYRGQIGAARNFVSEIEDATRRGLDPGFVVRLLKEGPEAAGPLLDQIVSDHSGRLIELTNKSEQALGAINRRAVELARLTQRAIESGTDKRARDLGRAQKIALEAMAEGRQATVESVAKALGLDPERAGKIAREFGITLMTEAQRIATARPIHIRTIVDPPRIGGGGGTVHSVARAAGGPVFGPGTSTSDSVPAWLSTGEYVVKAAAVARYGRHMFDALNSERYPRYAGGGPADRYPRIPGYATGGAVDRRQWTSNDRSINGPITVIAQDYADFRRQLDDDARFSALTGGTR